jgi:4-amino-4-deoxy-L-arabinose transferase-like glycosyltransferase
MVPPERHTRQRRTIPQERPLILALLLLGFGLRLAGLGQIPAGLYHDEAYHGLDALAVLGGEAPLYFEANNGREPLFIYLVTAAVALLGRTPLAVRLPAVAAGFLTLAAFYDLARTLWGRRAGVWALAVLTVTFWHVHLSRVGFRAVLLPLFTALTLSQAAKGLRSRHGKGTTRHWIAAGALYGAGWYTYMAARFTPVAVAAVVLYGLTFYRDRALQAWRGALVACLAALIVLLPLGLYTLAHPDVVLARTGQVSIFSDQINEGRPWAALGRHALATLGMFAVRGDRIWRHNLALRPVWDPALGLAFTLGAGVALARARRDPGAALSLIWTAVMALPTLLAEDAPHFLRAVGVLPTAALLPVLGLGWMAARLARLKNAAGRILPALVPALCIVTGLTGTTYDYFVRYAAAPQTYHWFEGGPAELAGEINRLRGRGWDGDGMIRDTATEAAVYIDRGLWQSWTAVPFLAPEEAVTFLPLGGRTAALDPGAAFIVWPYRDWEPDIFPAIPRPAYLWVEPGPEAQGDLDPEPFTIATITRAEARPDVPPPVGRFEDGVILRAALVAAGAGGKAEVRLWWETTAPLATSYTAFVHYLRGDDGDARRIAQHDGVPGRRRLPTTLWQPGSVEAPGDLILDVHPLDGVTPDPGRDRLRVGLYDPATGEGLAVLDADGKPGAGALDLPVILTQP